MNSNTVLLIVGKRGNGKSLWTKLYTRKAPRLIVHDIMGSYPVDEWLSGEALAERYESGWFERKKRFRIGVYDEADLEVTASTAFLVGDVDLIIEEAGVVLDKYKKPPDWLKSAVFVGRHRNLRLIVTAQRAASIPIDLRSQASRVVTFAQHEKGDLSALKPFFGNRVEGLPELAVYWCLDWDGVKVKKYSIEAPARKYLDGP